MGTYYAAINYTKRQCLKPHGLGGGAKWSELGGTGRFAEAFFHLFREGGSSFAGSWIGDDVRIVSDSKNGHDAIDEPGSSGWSDIGENVLLEIDRLGSASRSPTPSAPPA